MPRPGKANPAHNGILFIDELAEFDKSTLEIAMAELPQKKWRLRSATGFAMMLEMHCMAEEGIGVRYWHSHQSILMIIAFNFNCTHLFNNRH